MFAGPTNWKIHQFGPQKTHNNRPNFFRKMSTEAGLGACCLSGKLNDGKPVGREDQIGGLNVYVTEPKDGSKAKTIIFMTDGITHLLPLPSNNTTVLLTRLNPSQCSVGNIPTCASLQMNTPKPASTATSPTSKTAILSPSPSSTTSNPTSKPKKRSV